MVFDRRAILLFCGQSMFVTDCNVKAEKLIIVCGVEASNGFYFKKARRSHYIQTDFKKTRRVSYYKNT